MSGKPVKRSVIIAGHRTSVSLEREFWDELRRLARDDGVSVNELVTRIDRERTSGLSSAIRVNVLARLRAAAR
ncbi:MAG: ribbon-helix-helix domain-containing protein [Alphaproteobacteria bacterium]